MRAKAAASAARTGTSSRRPSLLRRAGINAFGPLPADTMFHEEARATYDCALCMYHDQALIPVKTLGFHIGVNTTLGLPFIRTSPDHGTALGLAGTGKANPSSFIAALRQATHDGAMARARARGMNDTAEDGLPPLARGDRAVRAVGAKVARPELPARSQPHPPHCARPPVLLTAPRCWKWSRPRRADPGAADGGRGKVIAVERDERTRPALAEIAPPGRAGLR